jgi:hypothetical protein
MSDIYIHSDIFKLTRTHKGTWKRTWNFLAIKEFSIYLCRTILISRSSWNSNGNRYETAMETDMETEMDMETEA